MSRSVLDQYLESDRLGSGGTNHPAGAETPVPLISPLFQTRRDCADSLSHTCRHICKINWWVFSAECMPQIQVLVHAHSVDMMKSIV